ncbi:ribosomal protein S19 (apicoplast) [Toxoplasma gondii RH]|uniref:Ribosomal protein S19 n=7 Tax=Toxoplasma gondii TaxID=5811 RepID=A0A086KZJ1_TOXGO|nr:ribosomal protein S19 [Toxoplasma gondii RH]AAD41135.1 ribosomal protein S19 [Toxoplasma gondii]KFG27524.1 ribosomal protein S19 [Toxoplasma gondii p89]KFG27552.1 ribosomal protein S19 [Toxoplasma gondii FOU]KFG49809.1 ribosomal protein S19 [Toxoplasma gondii RUB]KFG99171.1 ribosomal protein S19 [Toxoplasma gondii MAS]PUA92993.1 ribosomal protein S19 [Toxoplasma gondii TgCATBr9]|eukprot:NP_044548.1 ribosomal protein S19 (apicoplast) [Toxoplasma gondii RH]
MIKIIYRKLFIPNYFIKKSKYLYYSIKLYYKYLIITPFLIWKLMEVYTGKSFITINITKDKIGRSLQYFC